MANAGRVEMNMLMVGEDQLSAMLLKVNNNVEKTTATMQKAAVATTTLSEQHTKAAAATTNLADRVKSSIAPIDSFRTKVSNVTENAMFLAGGFGAVIGALTGFVALLKNDAFDAWLQQSRNMEESLARTRDLIFEVDVLIGKQQSRTAFEKAAADIIRQNEDAQRRLDIALEAEREALLALEVSRRTQFLTGQSLLTQQQELARIQDDIRMIEEERLNLGKAFTEVLAAQRLELAKTATDRAITAVTSAFRKALGVSDAEPSAPTRRPSGARRSPSPEKPSPLTLMSDVAAVRFPDLERVAMDAAPNISELFGIALNDAIVDGWASLRTEITETTDTMLSFLGVIDDAVQGAFPDLGAALQNLGGITEDYQKRVQAINDEAKTRTDKLEDEAKKLDIFAQAEKQIGEEKTKAMVSGTTAVLAGLAKEIGGLREYYLVKAAGEVAAGVATSFTNPAQSAAHFSAAALYGVAAARAGGGGGGGGSSSRPSTSSGTVRERDGGGTSVINISTLVTDRAAVRRVVGSVMARRDRSGYSGRGGA